MGTEPVKTILTREIIEEQNKNLCEENTKFLEEIINFLTVTVHKFIKSTKGKFQENENFALPMLLFHLIEISDAIRVLISVGIPYQCAIHLRSLFETHLYIKLILEEKDQFITRSLMWLTFCCHENIETYKKFVNGTYDEINKNNKIKIPAKYFEKKAIAINKINNLENLLKKEHFNKIEKTYNERKIRNWYNLVDETLNSLRDLSIRFRCEMEYEMVYKQYSKKVHGTDYQDYVKRMANKNNYILHDREGTSEITGYTSNWLLASIQLIFINFIEDDYELLRNCYIKEIKDKFNSVWKQEFIPE